MSATQTLSSSSQTGFSVVSQPVRMSCEIVTTEARLRQMAPDWQRLNDGGRRGTIFQQWEWVSAYCRAYGPQITLRVAAVYIEHRLIGILALQQRGESLEFLGTPEADYGDILCEEQYAQSVLSLALETILTPPTPWKRGVLKEITADSLIAKHSPELPPSLRRHLQLLYHCPSPVIDLDGPDRMEVLDALMKQDHLKRYDRKMQRSGVFSCRHLDTKEEAHRHLLHFFDQHICRNAMVGRKSRFQDAAPRAYFEALVDHCDPASTVRFSVIEVDGKPITYHFGFQLNGMFTYYSSSFDVNQADNSPGRALLRNLFLYCENPAIREFDFSIGDESYKFHYANRIKDNLLLNIDPAPTGLQSRIRAALRFTAAEIRRRPAIKKVVKQALDKFTSLFAKPPVVPVEAKHDAVIAPPLGIELISADLADLCRIASELTLLPDADRLLEAKRRLKRGDRAYLGEGNIYWAEKPLDLPKKGQSKKTSLVVEAPSPIPTEFYERWPIEMLGCKPVSISWMKRLHLTA